MNQTLPYSQEAHTVSQYTYQIAQDRGHAVIYPEHVLLSLIAYRNYRFWRGVIFFGGFLMTEGRLARSRQIAAFFKGHIESTPA